MAYELLAMFQDFQVFVAGILGFVGVIITLAYNAKISRDKKERELSHERKTLRVALKAELLINKISYEKRVQELNKETNKSGLVANKVINDVYIKLLDRIGILTEEEVESILNAYLLLSELPYRLRILVGTDNLIGLNKEIIKVNPANLKHAAQMHENFLEPINNALDSIERNYDK